MNQYVTAKQAAEALGVSLATLYAYTSRGQINSEPVPGRPRERRYFRGDVERLVDRKAARQEPERAAVKGLHWGSPVLASAITLIDRGRLYYRGRDAVAFAERASLEEAAALLWDGEAVRPEPASAIRRLRRLGDVTKEMMVRMQMALPVAGAEDLAAADLRPESVRRTGARILALLAAVASEREADEAVHVKLGKAWRTDSEAVRRALVLSADHELNASTFTARCAASAGASPYDAVAAAMATLKGRRHGGETERVAALFADARRADLAIAARMRTGEGVAGFGHPLYPEGDPRGAALLRLVETGGNRREWKRAKAIASAAETLLGEKPSLDFGLVALSRAFGMPEDAPLVLFAIGRTAGWVAHVMEQYGDAELIRPRARYIGTAPEAAC